MLTKNLMRLLSWVYVNQTAHKHAYYGQQDLANGC